MGEGAGVIGNPLISDSSVAVGQGEPSGKGGKDLTRYKYKRVKIKQEVERSDYPIRIASPPNTGNGLGGSQAAGTVGAKPFTFLITNRFRLSLAEACPSPPSANSVKCQSYSQHEPGGNYHSLLPRK